MCAAVMDRDRSPRGHREQQGGYSKRKIPIVFVWAMRAVIVLIAPLYLIVPGKSAAAADITVSPPDKNGRIFADVSGPINFSDEKTFGEKTQNLDADHTYLSLSSNGGNAISGGAIGDIIRFRGMSTYVPPDTSCTSICAFVWLAGRGKHAAANSRIGFHGPYNMHTLMPSNEMSILFAVYLAQLGYGYEDVLWMLLPSPGNMHWVTSESAKEHHIYWDKMDPPRELNGLYGYVPKTPAPAQPPVAATPKPRPVARYTASQDVNMRSEPRADAPFALKLPYDYIPAGGAIAAWQEERCATWYGARKPYGPKDFWCPVYYKDPAGQVTKGWVNAYYLLTPDGIRMGERFALNQEDDGSKY